MNRLEQFFRRARLLWQFRWQPGAWVALMRIPLVWKPTPAPAEWGPGWTDGILTPEDVDWNECLRRIRWAEASGLIETRVHNGRDYFRVHDPDWWEAAGEALEALRQPRS